MSIKKHCSNEEGAALLFTILMMFFLLVIVTSLTLLILIESRQANQLGGSVQAYMAAEAGYERAQKYIEDESNIIKQDQGVTNTNLNTVTYSFDVTLLLDGSYKFNSLGRSGNVARKLEGNIKPISPDQTKTLNLYDPTVSFDPASPVSASLFNLTPPCVSAGTCPVPPVNNYYLAETLDNLSIITTPGSNLFRFGVLDTASSNNGVGIALTKSGGNLVFDIEDITAKPAPGPSKITVNATITTVANRITFPTVNKVRFELTYRNRGASFSSATLKIKDPNTGVCKGVVTVNFPKEINPKYAFYNEKGPGKVVINHGTAGRVEMKNPGGTTLYLSNPFLMIY